MNNPFEVNQFALWVTLRGISKGAFEEINESLSGGAYCFGETLRASLAPLVVMIKVQVPVVGGRVARW